MVKKTTPINTWRASTGIEVNGEPAPYIKKPYSKAGEWSGTTLPWMAIGYELTITPLQLLAFYNAVANDGIYVKPHLVTEVQRYGVTLKKFPVTEVKGRIASKAAIAKAQKMLEGVVDSVWGTAHKLRAKDYRFAGKTGTAQLGYQRLENRTKVKGYQASFAGYFPAEDPVYSCIVLISKPKEAGIYGGQVALPVFREIADKAFASELGLFPVVNEAPRPVLASGKMPDYDAGYAKDLQKVLKKLGMDYYYRASGDWGVLRATAPDSLKIVMRTVGEKTVPNVVGMGLRDALFLLENKGLEVRVNGRFGKVKRQSIRPGTKAKGQTIWIRIG
ncbi:MAG: penicillin-binding transpeptidase domain-containing protein [Saprospiraceae bacterium]